MPSDPMTLIERLRNPAWHGSGFTHGQPAELDVKRTVADMAEAADEIESLRDALQTLEELGMNGMKPDYTEWLAFHDKVAEVAGKALNHLSK